MLSVAMPAMAQEESAEVVTEAVAEVEAAVEAVVAEEVTEEAAEVSQSTQGRSNEVIDREFSVKKALSDFVNQSAFKGCFEDHH